ncbi:calcium-binding protein, partial [Yoonia sediminilitoris]
EITGGGLLGDNGGPVQTIALKADATNPALDAAEAMMGPVLDAAGNVRVDLVGVGGEAFQFADMGALELVSGFDSGLVVTTLSDDGDAFDGLVSLREALATARAQDGADTITFASNLLGMGPILLNGSELFLRSDVTIDGDIDGDDVADIAIDAGGQSRVMTVFSGNTVTLDSLILTGGYEGTGYGGAISNAGSLLLMNSTLSNNVVRNAGGAISNFGALEVANSTFSYNSAFGAGGAIYSDAQGGAGVTVTNSIFSGNDADYGGAINIHQGTMNVTNSTFVGNSADVDGGGILNYGALGVSNSTFSNNRGDLGGGIDNRGELEVTNSTFNNNYGAAAGGIYNFAGDDLRPAGIATVFNSILLGNNTRTNSIEISESVTVNTSITGANGETAVDVFAQLDNSGNAILADNGGPVQTIALKADATNPALDAGDDTVAPTTDASGAARVDFRDDLAGNGTNISDLGALEALRNNPIGNSDANIINGDDTNNVLVGNGGDDQLSGLGGDDDLNGGTGDDVLLGGSGQDILVDAFGANQLRGGADNDILVALSGKNALDGDGGNDLIRGGIGADFLVGGDGNDVLVGDISDFLFGNDVLIAGQGDDLLQGGRGADVFVFNVMEDTNTIARLDIDYDNIANTSAIGVDFQVGIDRVDVSGFGFMSAADAYSHVVDNADGHATLTDQGTTIIFYGLETLDLSADNFLTLDI